MEKFVCLVHSLNVKRNNFAFQTVLRADPHIGLLHRGTEKLCEYKTYIQVYKGANYPNKQKQRNFII